MIIKRVLIIFNPDKKNAEQTALTANEWFQQKSIETTIIPYEHTDRSLSVSIQRQLPEVDLILVLGGDGTILGVAREIVCHPKPLLGVNVGGFGFLTSSTNEELEETLQHILDQNYETQHRYLLNARVIRKNGNKTTEIYSSVALNEALITLSHPGRLLEIWLGENRDSALAYRADGLIVSTPTGSTGHSLSAGGPILEPHLAALVIIPVSPHSLFNRPLVFSGEKELHIWFRKDEHKQMVLILDGQLVTEVQGQDEIIIQRSKHTITTISLPNRSFSQVLRKKFNLGEQSKR